MKKLAILPVIFFCYTLYPAMGQTPAFIYMEQGKFYEECEEYYPLTCVYLLDIIKDLNGEFHIAPHSQYCQKSNCWKGAFSCGKNEMEWKKKIRKHLDTIAAMGFNTIRLNGLAVQGHYNIRNSVVADLVSNRYLVQYSSKNPLCYLTNDTVRFRIEPSAYARQGDLFEEFLQIVSEHNKAFPDKFLRVTLLTAVGGLQKHVEEYASYLSYMGNRFKDNPLVMAYEINSEPFGLGYPQYEVGNKYEVANAFSYWYTELKKAAPMQCVTLGINMVDTYNWDAQIIPMDFINVHWYPNKSEPYNSKEFQRHKAALQWFSESFGKPWIIGETGLWANDRVHSFNNYIANEKQQKEYAQGSLIYARWYGAIGYTWWQYKELSWQKDDVAGATANFHGLVYREDTLQSYKAAAEAFKSFNPYLQCDTCHNASPDVHVNPEGYPTSKLQGSVRTSLGEPVQNAFIRAKGKTGKAHTLYRTFSDANGFYRIYGKTTDEIYKVSVSYPGMTYADTVKYYLSSPPGLDLNLTVDLLDPDRIPAQPAGNDSLFLTGNETTIWDSFELVNERYIEIDGPAALVIKGDVYLRPYTRIVVKEGGTLMIDGGSLNGLCVWKGIEVWERNQVLDDSHDRGKVILKNGAVIENAEVPLRTVKVQ